MYEEPMGIAVRNGVLERRGIELVDRESGASRGASLHHFAHFAAAAGTPEGDSLARRWRVLHTEYAMLSSRYAALMKQVPKLRMDPDEFIDRYDALDREFDELALRQESLYGDLVRWAEGVGGR